MRAIWKRELQAYFLTPTGYVFMGVFLLLSSVMFYLQIMQARSSDLPTFVGQMSYLWMLLSPVLTMRLLAEERQRRTDQLLLTSPVSLSGMVLGKYAAAYTVMAATVVLTLGFVAGVCTRRKWRWRTSVSSCRAAHSSRWTCSSPAAQKIR